MLLESSDPLLSPIVLNAKPEVTESVLRNQLRTFKNDILINQSVSSDMSIHQDIIDSWFRSKKNGLIPDEFDAVPVLADDEFQELISKKKTLIEAAVPLLEKQKKLLENITHTIFLASEQGIILDVLSNSLNTSSPMRYCLVPGAIWTEQHVGTCAHILSITLQKPIQLTGIEHYQKWDDIVCSTAPVFDPKGNLAGVIGIVTPNYSYNAFAYGLVISTAWAIQNRFLFLEKKYTYDAVIEAEDKLIIEINEDKIITRCNTLAQKILCDNLIGSHLESVFSNHTLFESVLKYDKPILNCHLFITVDNASLLLNSVLPLQRTKKNGFVLTFKQINLSDKSPKLSRSNENSDSDFSFDQIVGNSPLLLKAIETATNFASKKASILLQGESGTGKELFAKAIYHARNMQGPFVAINCAAIPRSIIESELFGYERGAFTGADQKGKPGKFEMANNGTIFLDEIGDLPLEVQPVLLRVLEEKKVMRLGGTHSKSLDFKMIAASNKNLLDLVKENKFRADLYYRISVLKIVVPPLRERNMDIIALAKFFIKKIAGEFEVAEPQLNNDTTLLLLQYDWPGNVRQLENTITYAVSTCHNGIINPEDLPEEINHHPNENSVMLPMEDKQEKSSIKEFEKLAIANALAKSNNKITEAARILGLSKGTMYKKIREYKLLDI